MDRSNIRNSTSFEENEAILHTMKTIHSLDEVYKTYVPQTVSKEKKPSSNSILKTETTEIRKSPNYTRPQANNLDPLISWAPIQNYQILSPAVQFSCIPNFSDHRHNKLLNHPENSAIRIASGQMNKKGGNCSSFDSTTSRGTQKNGLHTNSVSFAEPEMYSSYFSQNPSYFCDPGYYVYPNLPYPFCDCNGLTEQYQQQYLTDPASNYCHCQQPSGAPLAQVDGSSRSECSRRECSNGNSGNDTYFEDSSQDESKSIGSNKSVCGNEENRCTDPQVFEDYAPTSTECSKPAASSGFRFSSICNTGKVPMGPLAGLLNDSCKCHFNGASHHRDIRPSPKASCTSPKASLTRNRKVRIASDGCSKCSSRGSLRSGGSRRSVCSRRSGWSFLHTSNSERGLMMPDVDICCAEPPSDCCETDASNCQPELTCPPLVLWDSYCNECNPCPPCNPYPPSNPSPPCIPCPSFYPWPPSNTNECNCMKNSCMTSCRINDALQDCTVYRRDYQPIMTVCNHFYQHYGGCCWQDLPLGGGYGPCGGCPSCGGYGPNSNLPDCSPIDGHRYIPPSATLKTCSRPFCDRYPEESTGCDIGNTAMNGSGCMSARSSYAMDSCMQPPPCGI